ncbi:MAG: hypothetical protein WC356_03620 [Candidatus Micrarchaeia archaeon]|jgi:hypothetical protein
MKTAKARDLTCLCLGIIVGAISTFGILSKYHYSPNDKRQQPRWAERAYAETHGYFWLPCPICGKPFGGHEQSFGSLITELYPNGCYKGTSVCANCIEKANELNKPLLEKQKIILENNHK